MIPKRVAGLGKAGCIALLLLTAIMAPDLARAFKPSIHYDITKESLSPLIVTLGSGRQAQFSERAISEIAEENKSTDLNQFDPTWHFDNESIFHSNQRLVDLRSAITNIVLFVNDPASARPVLGWALHTLQDYYAHSNWVERGQALPNDKIGAPGVRAEDREMDTSENARFALCHAVAFGDAITPETQDSHATTGYFSNSEYLLALVILRAGGLPACLPKAPLCGHGYDAPLVGDFCVGINKDRPGRPGFLAARNLAVEASHKFVKDIIADIQANTTLTRDAIDSALRALLDQPDAPEPIVCNPETKHCYAMNRDVGLADDTWPGANAAARTVTHNGMRGHLATITSPSESTFISKRFPAIPGVGIAFGLFQDASGPEPAGGWRWVTGEPFSFSNWATGEPNNCCGVEEDFGFFSSPTNGNGHTWNDASNTGATGPYLIEFSPE